MTELPMPSIATNPEAQPFFAAAREGRFLLKRSVATARAHWYPRAHCPFDGGPTEWFEASGDATIYSFTPVSGPAPYVVAYVTLAEGPTMLTNIVDCEPASLAIGQPVRIAFRASGDEMVPCFSPLAPPPAT